MNATGEIEELLEKVKDIPALVEGKKDRFALESLFFTSIHELDRPIFEVVERLLDFDYVQILTDHDKTGNELYQKLRSELTRKGVKVDDRLRKLLRKHHISHVEGLDTFLGTSLDRRN